MPKANSLVYREPVRLVALTLHPSPNPASHYANLAETRRPWFKNGDSE